MKKVRITYPGDVIAESNDDLQREMIYEHAESDDVSCIARVSQLCTSMVSKMEYEGLKTFTVEVLE